MHSSLSTTRSNTHCSSMRARRAAYILPGHQLRESI